jgi:class 3 adenylate cyclase
MSEAEGLFTILRRSADAGAAIEALVRDGADRELCRVNALDFAARAGLDEERAIAAFLHAARLGLFELSWNVLCPDCGSVLDANATLKTLDKDEYRCGLCAAGYEPTLDEMVEVTFTVSPRVRGIAAHDPDGLPFPEYCRQLAWGSGVDLPEGFERLLEGVALAAVELPPGGRATLALRLPAAPAVVFDPVTHATRFLEVGGEPARDPQDLAFVVDRPPPGGTVALRPGPLRLSLENRAEVRALPGVWVADDRLHELLGRRRPFLTAKRLLTNQTFRDLYRTDTLDVDQRLRITSLTFLFTDLEGSAELYGRVGDLAAFDLVKAHFRALQGVVAAEGGAVVKTIGDAVMAAFPTPDRAVAAALRMRGAARCPDGGRGREDLPLRIGIHEGPCLAVTLNDRQDYFGQTVNIAARVQGLAVPPAILATGPVVEHPRAGGVLEGAGLAPAGRHRSLRGIGDGLTVYEIP